MDGTFLGAIEAITAAINENKDFLTDLDREIGDADHGVNMARGFNTVLSRLKDAPPADLAAGLKGVAMSLISTVGGASGPLYGTAFLRAAKPAQEKSVVDPELAAQMLRAAIDGVEARGGAARGDKTMIDALEPAYDAFAAAKDGGASLTECLDAAVGAAEQGIEFTKTIAARKGRASYLGDRSIGHQDPGATSVTVILKALAAYSRSVG